MTTIVVPSSRLIRLSSARTSFVVSGSSALVASSASRIRGDVASARAMPTRCFCPPESWLGNCRAFSAIPTNSSSSATRSRRRSRDQPAIRNG
jgi:hypothetical protein